MSVTAKKRENYKPLLWTPINISLDFQIYQNYTFVTSNILFEKNDQNNIKNFTLESSIELNGERK